MGKTLLLKAEIRESVGKHSAKKVREQGKIPATVYGHKQEPASIMLDAHDFTEGLHHGHRVMDIQVGKNKETMMVKDLQYDHFGKNIIHADLMRVDVTETVRVTVPIELRGAAKGAEGGGMLEEHLDRLEIECKVTDIPESIMIGVKEIEVGDVVHAKDIELPLGVTLISDPGLLVLTCHLVAAAKTTEEIEEEAPAAPEIITEKKEEEVSEG